MSWQGRGKTFFPDNKGAATVYLLLVGAATLTLFLAVFNYGRFLMAQRQVELALEASLNSLLSYYDRNLAREMGLFAFDTRDALLAEKGREYFLDNIGGPGTINGQTCESYTVSYPEEGRLDISAVLAAQAVDLKRIEGWTGMVSDLLSAVGITDWGSLLSFVGKGPLGDAATGEGAGLTGDMDMDLGAVEDAFNERVDNEERNWVEAFESNRERDDGRIRIWQLLSARAPEDVFVDRMMPAEIRRGAGAGGFGLWGDAAFWEGLFLDPRGSLGGLWFLTVASTQIYDLIDEIKNGIPEALTSGYNKALLIEYIIGEMDFATNKPVMDRYFSRAEVEFMLYRRESSWGNVRQVALKILILRSCLHLVDAATSGKIVDEITLAAAVVEAVIKGGWDVEKLYAGERVPAYPGLPRVTISYKDHLRLLLTYQSEKALRSAAQGLAQANLWYWAGGGDDSGTGAGFDPGAKAADGLGSAGAAPRPGDFALSRYGTEVRAEVRTELSLWPFGTVKIHREGIMGYDKPFALLYAR